MLMTCMIFFRGKPAFASQWLWLHGPSSMGVSENGYTPQNGNFNKGKDHSPCDFAVPNFQTTPTCRPLVLRTHFIMIASQNAAPIMSIASWKFNAPPRLTVFRASLSELPWFSHSAENNGAILGPEIGHLQYNTKEPSRESSWDILMWAKWFQCFGNITQPGFTCFKNVCWEKNVQIDQFTKEQNIWLEWKNPATLCCPHLVLLYQVICCFCIQSLPGWQLIPLPSAGEIESMNQYLRCHGNSTASEHWSMYGIWSYWKNDDFP